MQLNGDHTPRAESLYEVPHNFTAGIGRHTNDSMKFNAAYGSPKPRHTDDSMKLNPAYGLSNIGVDGSMMLNPAYGLANQLHLKQNHVLPHRENLDDHTHSQSRGFMMNINSSYNST